MAILLDIDGVMVDLVGGICSLYGKKLSDIKEKWRVTSNNWADDRMSPALDTTTQDIWDRLEAGGIDFWLGLKELQMARSLYEHCKRIQPTYFVTAPTPYENCLRGKLAWMKRFTGNPHFMEYMIGRPKFLCANANNILIDDGKKNCEDFVAHGGRAILYPQFWNGNDVEYPWADVINKLDEMLGGNK